MDDDAFLRKYQSSDLKIASEFLTTWLPFLSRDLCNDCVNVLSDRIRSLDPDHCNNAETAIRDGEAGSNYMESEENDGNNMDHEYDGKFTTSLENCDSLKARNIAFGSLTETLRSALPSQSSASEIGSSPKSWADMAQEDGFEGEESKESESGTQIIDVVPSSRDSPVMNTPKKPKLSREQREHIRFMNVKRNKEFTCIEKVKGKNVNILEGLELHTGVFSAVEQKRIVDLVYELQEKGHKGELKERTFTAPHKWMRGKGRVTIQFGCCYNYATDKAGNPPGILARGEVDPIPHLFKVIIRRLVGWHVLPPTCVPDSCIVNIYDEGDCIPPHIDNHDFLRPFCTISFLSECNILFGSNLKIEGPGEFSGSYAIPLPVGSVLVLKGNGADVAKHCVPAVPTKRISITFRKMDESKQPIGFTPEPDLQGIQPLPYEPSTTPINSSSSSNKYSNGRNHKSPPAHKEGSRQVWRSNSSPYETRRPNSTTSYRAKVNGSSNT